MPNKVKFVYVKSKRRRKKRNKVRAIRKALNYNFSTRPQTYGPGRTAINVTRRIDTEFNDVDVMNFALGSSLFTSSEFLQHKEEFKYFKIEGISITVYPNDTLNNIPTYINLEWSQDYPTSYDEIVAADSTKITYNDAKSIKTYTFIPPNSQNTNYLNLRQWQVFGNEYGIYAYLSLAQQSGNVKCRVDMRVSFKGSKVNENADDSRNLLPLTVGDTENIKNENKNKNKIENLENKIKELENMVSALKVKQ